MERDKKVSGIYEDWNNEAPKLTKDVLDKIGELWITKILGCNQDTVNSFKTDAINNDVGLKHSGTTEYYADSRGFWEEINMIAPKLAPKEDLQFLIEHDDSGTAAWALICTLDASASRIDTLTTKLVNNALLYK